MGEPAVPLSQPTLVWRQSFTVALVNGYPSWEAMKRLVDLGLGENLEAYVTRGPLNDVVVGLLQWADARSRLADLVKAAVTLCPAHVALRTCAREMGWEPQGSDPQVQVANVRIALRMMTLDPNIRVALAGFRAVFENADRRLQRVAADKALHDRLHDFQMFCFVPLLSLARTFPLGETRAQLQVETLTYKRELQKIRTVVETPMLADADLDWITDSLTPAYDLLCAAAAESSLAKLQQGLRLIRDVVQLQPTVVNAQLIRAVEDLDLGALVTSLTEVHTRLTAPTTGDELSQRVARAVEDLKTLHAELTRLVASHRDWQKVDNAIRLFESTLTQSPDALGAVWAVVDRACLRVYTDPDPSTAELRDVGALLATAVADPQHGSMWVFFPRFQSLAGARFYQVDKDVKQLCDRLAPIGAPLDEFVKQLSDAPA